MAEPYISLVKMASSLEVCGDRSVSLTAYSCQILKDVVAAKSAAEKLRQEFALSHPNLRFTVDGNQQLATIDATNATCPPVPGFSQTVSLSCSPTSMECSLPDCFSPGNHAPCPVNVRNDSFMCKDPSGNVITQVACRWRSKQVPPEPTPSGACSIENRSSCPD